MKDIKVPEDKIQERTIQEINMICHELSKFKKRLDQLDQQKTKKLSILWGLYSVEK